MAEPLPEAPPEPTRPVSAEDARGGGIILRRKWERAVFLAGLIGAILIGLVVCFAVWR